MVRSLPRANQARISLVFFPFADILSELHNPLSPWRRAIVFHAGRFLAIFAFKLMGFYSIKEIGAPDVRRYEPTFAVITHSLTIFSQPRAKTIVSNHVTFVDVIFFMRSLVPSFVAKVRSHTALNSFADFLSLRRALKRFHLLATSPNVGTLCMLLRPWRSRGITLIIQTSQLHRLKSQPRPASLKGSNPR